MANDDKSFRKAFKEPAVLAALVTVLIGSIAATIITGLIQWRAQVREFEQGWLKARGDQALVSYREYLDQEQALIRRAYSLIGACTSEADNLTGLLRPEWNEHNAKRDVELENQKDEIIKRFNATKRQWHSEKGEIGLLMSYYHPGERQVMANWNNVEKAVTDYLKCKQSWHDDYINGSVPQGLAVEQVMAKCNQEYTDLIAGLGNLSSSLESSRRYAWTGWESPQETRALLNKDTKPSP
jgi:hypothetical protein